MGQNCLNALCGVIWYCLPLHRSFSCGSIPALLVACCSMIMSVKKSVFARIRQDRLDAFSE